MQPVSVHPAVSHGPTHYERPSRQRDSDVAAPTGGKFDEVLLSPRAQALVDEAATRPGKSALSPAHEARRILALDPDHAGQPFGQTVSQVARDLLSSATVAAATETSLTDAEPFVDATGADTSTGLAAEAAAGEGAALPAEDVSVPNSDALVAEALGDLFGIDQDDAVA